MSNEFEPTGRCHNATVMGHTDLSHLKGSITSKSAKVSLPFCISMVRPHQGYCLQACSPYNEGDKDEIRRSHR